MPQDNHHARIMIECGCTLEDIAITLRMRLVDAMHACAASLHANPAEQKRVQKILRSMKLPPLIPVVHRRAALEVPLKSTPERMRTAA